MEINSYSAYQRVEKSITPTLEEIQNGALVQYNNGYLETISGHIRFFERQDGTDEWTAGSSDDVTDNIVCWFKKIK